jgi:DNA-binding PadR family transcriptional regulator
MPDQNVGSLSPLPNAVFHILIALADRERHGYSIMQDVSERTGGKVRLSAGTLYSSIHRMLEQGLVEELRDSPDPASSDERRRYYRITKRGRQVALAEAQRLSELLNQARATGLIPKRLSMGAIGLYRALLRCYPASFRQEYGSEMLAAFAAQVREARQQGGRWVAAFIELQTIVDLLLTAAKEHYHVTRLDMRYAIRTLVSQPGFTTVAVLSLALGIGANIAIFSLLNSVLLGSLPVEDPKSLIMLTNPESSGFGNGSQGGERTLLTYTEYEQLRDRTGVFSSLMACESQLDRVQAAIDSRQPEELRFRMVSNGYFETLGVPALVGRTLQPSDELQSPYAVISYELWQRRFGGRVEAIGQKITIRRPSSLSLA